MATKEVKMVSLGDFLTEEQTRRCWGLYPNREQIRDKIVKPNLASINEKLGQENDADYLSYAIVHVIGQGREAMSFFLSAIIMLGSAASCDDSVRTDGSVRTPRRP